jgi:hypothetical protein
MDTLEQLEGTFEKLVEEIKKAGVPFMKEIGILTSMSGISVYLDKGKTVFSGISQNLA